MAILTSHVVERFLTPGQISCLQVVATLSGLLSLVAVFPPAYNLWKDSREGKKASIAQQYFSVLLTMNGVTALMYAIGRLFEENTGLCDFQAYIIQVGGLAIQIFEAYIAVKMYYLIVKKMAPDRLAKKLNRDVTIIYLLCFGYALIFLFAEVFGPDSAWCWIEGGKDDILRFYALYISLMISFMVCISSMIVISRSAKGSDDVALSESETRVKNKLFAYVKVFIFCWIWGLLNRIIESATLKTNFSAALIQAMVQPLQGLLNTLVYHNSFTAMYNYFWPKEGGQGDVRKLKFQKNVMMSEAHNLDIDRRSTAAFSKRGSRLTELRQLSGAGSDAGGSIITMGKLASGLEEKQLFTSSMNAWEKYENCNFVRTKEDTHNGVTRYKPKFLSVFTTTFNLGEASAHSLRANIADWLLPNHDIYAIGMQEALELVMLRDTMLKHLGGRNEYVMFTEEIGSDNTAVGYHGYIALTVFVRKSEVDNGCVREINTSRKSLATGRNLGLAKATNKGGVGIPFQIHDTSICFLTSHLPSDSKGSRKLEQRNICAHDILSQLTLSPADLGFSLQKQTDHIIFTGDMNYRIFAEGMSGGGQVCQAVAAAATLEKEYIGAMDLSSIPGNWREKRTQLLRSIKNDPLALKPQDASSLMEARIHAAADWADVVKHDELTTAMTEGFAFSGFEEAHIAFAPTYKRKIGAAEGSQHCGDYTNASVVFEGFSNTEGMEAGPNPSPPGAPISHESNSPVVKVKDAPSASGAKLAKKMRPPSYTDRILVSSLPNRTRRLAFQAYDTCETMLVSDHRPVSMVMTLEVNSAVIFPINFVEKLDVKKFEQNVKNGSDMEIVGKGRFFLYELVINNLKVNLLEHEQKKEDVILDDVMPTGPVKRVPMGGAIAEGDDDDGDEEMGWGPTRNPLFPSESSNAPQIEPSSAAPTSASRPMSSRMVDIDLNRNSEISGSSHSDKAHNDSGKDAASAKKTSKKRPSLVGALFSAGKDLITGGKKEKEEGKSKSRSIKSEISRVQVCFPLPGKDPLLRFRQISLLAKAFEVSEKSILDSFQEVALRALENKYPNEELNQVNTDTESLTTDVSVFPCTCQHKISRVTENGGVAEITSANGVDGEIIHSDFISCGPMRVCGCVVPELGTHVIIALVDSKGENHGEFTISLSHLVDLKSNSRKDDEFSDIPVSRGGELRGKASGMFSLSLLTILSTDESPMLPKMLS